MAVVWILAGALLAGLTSLAFGTLLAQRLQLCLASEERAPLGFLLGAPILSLIVFLLCAAHVYHRGVIIAVCVAAIAAAWIKRTPAQRQFEPLGRTGKLLLVAYIPFFILYLTNAVAPEKSPDGSTYHVGLIAHYLRSHGFVTLHTTIYASLSQGIEMLYLVAYTIGKNSSAALTHLLFLIAACWLMICYGRRKGHPLAAIAGAFFFFASPVVGVDGSAAYIDVACAAILFAVFYATDRWESEQKEGWLIVAGLLSGFAFAAKYTAGVILLYPLIKARRLRPVLLVSGCALILIAPWMLKNLLETGDPLAPFFNRWFPNPYVHVAWEEDYKQYFRTYDMPLKTWRDWWRIPWDAAVRGQYLNGVIGPLFLLAPVALLGLKRKTVRQLLLAAAIALIPYPLNIGARFLILALPFVSLAMAEVFSILPPLLPALVILQASLGWPRTPPGLLNSYASESAWRLIHVEWKPALRIEPEERFLARMMAGYRKARLVDELVPDDAPVFAFSSVLDAYTRHEVAVSYQSAFGEHLAELLYAGMMPERLPVRLMRFRIPESNFRKIRVEQTQSVGPLEQWSVNELRIFDQDRELPRVAEWRLTAHPNPWDIRLAFDNSPVTRWRTEQRSEPGDYVEVDFGRSQPFDRVDVETSADHWMTRIRLLGTNEENGPWTTLAQKPEEIAQAPPNFARRMATLEIAANGIEYLLIDSGDYRASDITSDPSSWGLKLLGEAGGAKLYSIEPVKKKP